ncbi:hypothetical protein GTO91_02795 [Heliobacterium undosum]|uniref:Septation protein SpoVG n=1 Tax=Heliomicrobium undosum TaxID=121734 RepID=A0A845KY28_9FIRM|nr:SpoVG family protein [Heliomicrobium undosum]MZP28647.1 hypothetical protein [Heliomicrobium undosum]
MFSTKITEVRFNRVNLHGSVKALASVTIDDSFAVHEIKVIEGKNGLFIAMPSQVLPDGTVQFDVR